MKVRFVKLSSSWLVTLTVAAIFSALTAVSLGSIALDGKPLSIVDEHIHLDYAVKLSGGNLPYRGELISDQVVEEWLCGVGHQAGAPAACSELTSFDISKLPSGKYSTAYIHFPTYFSAATAFSQIAIITSQGTLTFLDGLRLFSATLISLSVGLAVIFARGLRLSLTHQLLAATLPIAASSTFFFGTVVNPSAAALLCGTLVAGFGLLWFQRGKGFIWLALAALLGSLTAFIINLPTFAFALCLLILLFLKKLSSSDCPVPRASVYWRHPIALLAIGILPMVFWVFRISQTATVPNSALYAFASPPGAKQVLVNLLGEVLRLHSPWYEAYLLTGSPENRASLLQDLTIGIPGWVTLMVVGTLIFFLIFGQRKLPESLSRSSSEQETKFKVLVVASLATLVLFPVFLRLSNLVISGFDYPIVDRYSISLVPLLVFLALNLTVTKLHKWLLGLPAAIAYAVLVVFGLTAAIN